MDKVYFILNDLEDIQPYPKIGLLNIIFVKEQILYIRKLITQNYYFDHSDFCKIGVTKFEPGGEIVLKI